MKKIIQSLSSFVHSFISAFIGRIGKFVGFVGFIRRLPRWWKVIIVIVVIEAVAASLWWFKPPFIIPPFVVRLLTPKKPPVTYAFKSAPKETGFSLLSDNTKSGGFKALIGKKESQGTPEARFEVEKGWMEFALAGGTDVRSFESQKKDGKDTIIWKNVLTDTDVRYQIVENGLKEDIILKSDFLAQRALEDKDKVTISFDLTTFNVLPRTDTSGKMGLAFMDASSGDYRFHIEPPYLVDNAGARFDAINYKLEPVGVAGLSAGALAKEGGSLFKENIAVGKDEVKHHDPDARIKSEHEFVDTAKFKIHESVSFLSSYVDRATFAIDRLFPSYYHIRSDLADSQGPTLRKAFAAPPAGNKWRLTLTLPKEWLADPGRAYPVILDPTVTHNTQTAFATGTLNRVKDEGASDSAPLLIGSYHELPADINTVGLWHMNENAANTCTGGVNDVCDASGNSNDGAFNGNATHTTSSKLGASAATFDGTGDYIQITDNDILDPNKAITVEAWVKPSDVTAEAVVGKRTSGNVGGYLLYIGSGVAYFYIYNGAFYSASGGTLTAGNWYHLVGTYDGATIRIYVDGKEVGSTARVGTIDNTTASLRIGYSEYVDGTDYAGQIDEVRISNIARTPEEIKANAQRFPYSIFTSPVMDLTQSTAWNSMTWLAKGVRTGDGETPISTTNLVAQWNFNETSGTTAVSGGSCGTSCNGTLTNFASTASQDQAAGTGWTAANRRWGAGALMFDGTNDFVSVPDNNVLDFGTGDFTVEAWINTNQTSRGIIAGKFNAAGDLGYALGINQSGGTNKVFLQTYNAGTSTTISNATINDGKWHFIVGIRSGGSGTIQSVYVDGMLDITATVTARNPDNDGVFALGRYGSYANSYFSGTIDSTRIYNRALTASEILANYQAGNIEFQTRTSADNSTWEAWKPTTNETALDSLDSLSPVEKISQTSLTAYWKLDETSGSRADSKGANTLTDNNTVTYAPGRLGNAGQFTRANSEYLSVADNVGISTNGSDFTVAAWVNLNSKSGVGGHAIITKYDDSVGAGREFWFIYDITNDKFQFDVSAAGGETQVLASSLGSPSTGTWYYIVAWHDSVADTINIQVNNGTVNSAAHSFGSRDSTTSLLIGALTNNSNYYFDGKIDEVAFWKRTLTAAERTQLYSDGLDLHGAGSGRIYRTRDTTTKIEGTASEKLQLGAPQVDASTVGLWHLEETNSSGNGIIKDSTSGANNLTIKGTPSVVDGFYGKGRSFNGSTDFLCSDTNSDGTCDDNNSLDLSSNFSVGAWVKFNGLDGNIFTKSADNCGTGWYFHSWNTVSGKITLCLDGTRGSSNTIPSLGQWYHAVATYDGSNIRIYINGTLETTTAKTGSVTNTTAPFGIGTSNASTGNHNGSIDEPFIKNVVMSAEEIAEAYRAGRDHRISKTISSTDLSAKTKLPFYVASDRPGTFLEATVGESALLNNFAGDPDMKGYWPLDETSTGSVSTTRNDYSGNGNNLTDNNTTASGQGKIGKAGDFESGNSEYLSIADNASLSAGDIDFTVVAWVNMESKPAGGMTAMSKYDDSVGANREWRLGLEASATDKFIFGVRGSAAETNQYANSLGSPSTGTWYFIVAWHDSVANTINIQVNGGAVDSTSHTAGSTDSGTALFVGGLTNNAGQYWDGLIDETMFIKRVLTADERRQMFEVGKRTHPVTIDFVTSPQAAYSSGTSVTINNPYGTSALTNSLSVNDTIIFKENVGGTETVSQAVVNAIANTTSTYGTVTLASAPTFPTGGYSTNAKVFKWQREYFDLTGSLGTHRDAVTRITLRVTDGLEGRNVWLDDFRSSGGYITDNTPDSFNTTTGEGTYSTTSIPSTLNRYFQYRAILSSWDTAVSPQFTSATLDYASNAAPGAPTVSAPTNAATNQKFRPVIQLAATDSDSDYLRYKIQIATDTGFTTGLQTFDQTASQTGWSGQNASSSTAYSSGSTASYTIQSVLSTGTTYYVRAYAKDPVGSDTWSSASTTTSFTVVDIPTAAAATSVEISSFTMNWSGPATYTSYRLDVSTASDFASFVTNYQDKTVAGTSDSITGLNLATGATYYYRVRGVDSNGDTSANSATITARLGICNPNTSGAYTATSSCRFENTYDGVQEGNFVISAGKTVTVNAGQRIAWTPGNSITINPGSTIAIAAGAQLIQGYVVYTDADADLYVATSTATVSATTVPSGYTKRALVRTFAFNDRNDSNSAAYESRPLLDSSGNYGGWSGSDANATTISTDNSTTYLSSMGAMQAVMTSVNTGTGADGALSVTSGTTTINTTVTGTAAGTSGNATLTVASTTGFSSGNEVLLVQMTGTGAGNYEFRTISAVNSATQVTFTASKTNTYTNDGSSKAQMIKVPQYTTVSVSSGATLTAGAWDGTIGGVLVFRATGTVTNSGTIDMNGKGFSGGSGASGGGGGGGMSVSCSQGTKNTNWGSSSPGSSAGSVGTGIGAGSGGGGAGGLGGRANAGGGAGGGGGGGGGYAAAGTAGGGGSSSVGGWNCPAGTNGRNNGFTTSGGSAGAAGSTTYGATNLATVFLGSGGGGGAAGAGADGGACDCDANLDKSCNGGGSGSGGSGATGGTGGGVIVIIADAVTNSGTIRSNGSNGSNGTAGSNGGNPSTSGGCDVWASGGGSGAGGAGGGGGSGGSIILQSPSVTVGTMTASGGSGGSAGSSPGTIANGAGGCYGDGYCGGPGAAAGSGGAGAAGRIRIDNSGGNATGSSPAPYTAALPSPQNVTLNRTLPAPIDLSGINHVSFWVNSAVTGSVLRLQMGEAAVTEQTFDFSVTAANTWEEKSWDISLIAASSRNAIQYLQFKYLSGTSGTFRIDGLTYYE